MIDGLEEQALGAREDRGDRVHELGEVRDAHGAAVSDEAVQVARHREGIGEVVALLHAAHAVLMAPRPVPDVPLVEGDVDGMGDLLGQAHALDQRRADPDRALGLVRLEDGGVVIGRARVQVNAVEVHQLGEAAQHDLVPLAPAGLPAADELDGRVGPLHDHREGPRPLDVVVGVQVADLPAPVHLVAEAPVPDAMGLGMAVLPAQARPGRLARPIAVLDPGLRLVHRARPHVHADEGLGPQLAAVRDELVGPEAVRLLGIPGELASPRALVHWARRRQASDSRSRSCRRASGALGSAAAGRPRARPGGTRGRR